MKEERKHVSVTVDAMLWRRLKANATWRGVKMGEMLDLVLEKMVGNALSSTVVTATVSEDGGMESECRQNLLDINGAGSKIGE